MTIFDSLLGPMFFSLGQKTILAARRANSESKNTYKKRVGQPKAGGVFFIRQKTRPFFYMALLFPFPKNPFHFSCFLEREIARFSRSASAIF